MLYEALQDQSTAVPITVHNYGTVVYVGSGLLLYQLGPAVQPSVVVVYIQEISGPLSVEVMVVIKFESYAHAY